MFYFFASFVSASPRVSSPHELQDGRHGGSEGEGRTIQLIFICTTATILIFHLSSWGYVADPSVTTALVTSDPGT